MTFRTPLSLTQIDNFYELVFIRHYSQHYEYYRYCYHESILCNFGGFFESLNALLLTEIKKFVVMGFSLFLQHFLPTITLSLTTLPKDSVGSVAKRDF